MKRSTVGALAAGALFGVGLVVSGMADPRNVIGFLDFTGQWNPRLIAVMAGAVGVHATLLALLARAGGGRGARLLPPRNNRIDRPLIVGAALFGIGWGLSGYCPGPAIASLGFGARSAFVFVAAMIAGIVAAGLVPQRRSGCESTTSEL
jgi:uncharacterized membrane protein YedE/YeeE